MYKLPGCTSNLTGSQLAQSVNYLRLQTPGMAFHELINTTKKPILPSGLPMRAKETGARPRGLARAVLRRARQRLRAYSDAARVSTICTCFMRAELRVPSHMPARSSLTLFVQTHQGTSYWVKWLGTEVIWVLSPRALRSCSLPSLESVAEVPFLSRLERCVVTALLEPNT